MAEPNTSLISAISQNQPDPTAGIARAYQIKDLINQSQMQDLQLQQAKTQQTQMAEAQKVLKNSDLSTVQGQQQAGEKLTQISPKMGMDFLKQVSENQSTQSKLTKDELDLHNAKADTLASTTQGLLLSYQDMISKGVPPPQAATQMNAQYQQTVQGLVDQKLPNGQPVLNTTDIKQLLAHPQFDPQFLTQISQQNIKAKDQIKLLQDRQKQAQETQHQKVEEQQGGERLGIEKQKLDLQKNGFSAESGDLMAELAIRGVSLPTGFRAKAEKQAMLQALLRDNPGKTPGEIADGIKSGQLSFGADKTEASVLGRREAAILPVEKSITKPGGFLDQAEKAVNDVDFSKLKAAGAFENWKGDQLSDPKLTKYRAAVAELRAEYALVLSKGGQVTDAARHEAEKVIPDLITKDQFKSIRQTVNQGIESSKGGVEESLSGVTGKPSGSNGAAPSNDPLGIR